MRHRPRFWVLGGVACVDLDDWPLSWSTQHTVGVSLEISFIFLKGKLCSAIRQALSDLTGKEDTFPANRTREESSRKLVYVERQFSILGLTASLTVLGKLRTR